MASNVDGDYRLQPGDQLRVKYLYHPELDIKVLVQPDGNVVLPVAGEIRAAGLRPAELEQVIKERTSDHLRDPEISVMVAGAAERKVYVGGQVRIPGFVTYSRGMSALQAIMDRGGFSDTARLDSVLRVSAAPNDVQATRLDFTKSLSNGSQDGMHLAAGDVLYVPRTFIGDVDLFIKLYIRDVLPTTPHFGAGTSF
ncbi:MAG: polysaccharide biosynthesis/export family protein [Candidatus Binatia bacterium]